MPKGQFYAMPLAARRGHQRMDQLRSVIRSKLEEWKPWLGNLGYAGISAIDLV
jgi:hypothetical protein